MASILLTPDSFKGSATSTQVAQALRKGWLSQRPTDQIEVIAFGDGGEGTLECIAAAVNKVQRIDIRVQGADGQDHDSYWLLVNGDTAVIEMAILCGITTVAHLDPLGTHSFGLGQAIKAALLDERVKEVLIAVGGSASTDAGVGALVALGQKVMDCQGRDVALGGQGLHSLAKIERRIVREPVRGLKVLVDVQSPMTGLAGAAHVFGPQKGASKSDVDLLDSGLKNFLSVVGSDDRAGYGAAGGVSGGLATVLGAQIVSGVETLARVSGLLTRLDSADCVVTGEGAFDNQSFAGKVVGYVLNEAAMRDCPAMVVCGVNKNGPDDRVISLAELAPSVEDAMIDTASWIEVAGQQLALRFDDIAQQ